MSSPTESHDQDLTNVPLFNAKLYHLYLASHEDFGVSTGGSTTTLADSSKNWATNTWANYMAINVSTGEERIISSNTAHVLTVTVAWDRTPLQGHIYKICGPNWVFGAINADAATALSAGILESKSNLFAFNGTTWDRARNESSTQPGIRTGIWQGGVQAGVGNALGDANTSPAALNANNFSFAFNGTTWDRIRNNLNLYNVSNTTTTTFTGADIATFNAKALLIVIDCTSLTGTSYTPEIDWKDGAGNYPVLWKQSTAKTATARTVIALGPGSAGAVVDAGAAAGDAGLGTVDSATAGQLVQIPFAVPNIIRILITKSAVTAFTANLQVQGS